MVNLLSDVQQPTVIASRDKEREVSKKPLFGVRGSRPSISCVLYRSFTLNKYKDKLSLHVFSVVTLEVIVVVILAPVVEVVVKAVEVEVLVVVVVVVDVVEVFLVVEVGFVVAEEVVVVTVVVVIVVVVVVVVVVVSKSI